MERRLKDIDWEIYAQKYQKAKLELEQEMLQKDIERAKLDKRYLDLTKDMEIDWNQPTEFYNPIFKV